MSVVKDTVDMSAVEYMNYLDANPIELAHIQAAVLNDIMNMVGESKRGILYSNLTSRYWDDLFCIGKRGKIAVSATRLAALCTPYPEMNKSQTLRYAMGMAMHSQDPVTFDDEYVYRLTFGGSAVNGSYGNGPHYGVPEPCTITRLTEP